MVELKEIEQQLKKINFNMHSWGMSEVKELTNILLEGEKIYEAVNGVYESGFALLVATDVRVLLVDKKPLSYLTVEDLRFDMISEMDYKHRLMDAQIIISSGSKTLKFTSVNKPRLRKLIGHVQHSIADSKQRQSSHQEGQTQHLEEINQRLEEYLEAVKEQNQANASSGSLNFQQLQDMLALQKQLLAPQTPAVTNASIINGTVPLSAAASSSKANIASENIEPEQIASPMPQDEVNIISSREQEEMYQSGIKEIYGDLGRPTVQTDQDLLGSSDGIENTKYFEQPLQDSKQGLSPTGVKELSVNPIFVAYSKLPMAMRNKRFASRQYMAHGHNGSNGDKPFNNPLGSAAPSTY